MDASLTMVSFMLTNACVNLKLGSLIKFTIFKLVYSGAEIGPGNLMSMVAIRIERNLFFDVQMKLPQEISWKYFYKWICTDFHYVGM